MTDIRSFFTSRRPRSPVKSSLTDERLQTGSPRKVKTPLMKPQKPHIPIVLDDDDSDYEDPVPKVLKPAIKKKENEERNKRRVILESSEEEFFDESVGEKIGKKEAAEALKSSKRKNVVESSDEDFVKPNVSSKKRKARVIETPSPVKVSTAKKAKKAKVEESSEEDEPVPKKKSKKKKAKEPSPETMDFDIDESDTTEEEIKPVKKERKGRRRTPPNQQKLDAMLSKKVPANKKLPKDLPPKKEAVKVDPMDFFNNSTAAPPKPRQRARKPPTPVKTPEIILMTDSEDEKPAAKKSKVTPPTNTNKKAETPKKIETSKKNDVLKKRNSHETSKKKNETPKKDETSKKPEASSKKPAPVKPTEKLPKKESKKNGAKEVFVPLPTYDHPTPPKALPALPPPKRAELPWVDKYKPASLKEMVGQGTPASPTNKLLKWLKEWAKNNLGVGGMIKKVKPSPFEAQRDGTAFKAALLSGPPGIGKTTSSVLVCKELGLKFVEMNASDARNKKLLDDKIAELLGSRQVNEYFTGETPKSGSCQVTHVLIMDEVDGMSGNQDRAGIAELIQMIKTTKIPIICICNDRQSMKIRSLANHCFDLRFQRPSAVQIKAKLMSVKVKEKVQIPMDAMEQIIEASNQDLRQCIYSLQLYASGAKGKVEKKDISVNIFEAARRILSKETTIAQKQEMYFSDYSIMPLFVQENFPHVRGEGMNNLTHLNAIRRAANCIAEADLIDKQIRSNGAWNLLPEHGMLSSALPAMYLDGHMTNQLAFPSWLGKNSSANKRQRMMRQLASHAHLKITGTCHSIVTDYLPVLRDHIYRPLVQKESEGVREVIELYKHYDLTRDDTEAINELAVWPGARDIAQNVNTKTKSALTRNLNKESRLLPYSVGTVQKGRKKAEGAAEVELDEEGHVVERKIGVGSDDEGAEDDDEKDDDGETPEIKITVKTTTSNDSGKGTVGKRGGSTAARGARGGRGRGKGPVGKRGGSTAARGARGGGGRGRGKGKA
uniref:Replication factor C subunit 1 n=1 Tax=Panagrolaimus sp. ES5 TaxID=591445 RepID=A0AC34FHK5_9BILA